MYFSLWARSSNLMHNGPMMDLTNISQCLQTRVLSSERGDHDLNPELLKVDEPLRHAAVLVLLVEHDDSLSVLFTKRTENLEHHPGQISFPGGHIEPSDQSPIAAALRETHEEVGIAPEHTRILGRLDNYITRTGFHITPVVGTVRAPLNLSPDPREVDEVFEVPLAFLLDPANHHTVEREFQGAVRRFYAIPYGDYYIWGATAGMLMDLYQTLKPA